MNPTDKPASWQPPSTHHYADPIPKHTPFSEPVKQVPWPESLDPAFTETSDLHSPVKTAPDVKNTPVTDPDSDGFYVCPRCNMKCASGACPGCGCQWSRSASGEITFLPDVSFEPYAPAPDVKKAAGSVKCPLQLLPASFLRKTAKVLGHGAAKYGAWNWRRSGVEQDTYIGAIMRHLMAMQDGEWLEPQSGLPHAAHIAASCAILIDCWDHRILKGGPSFDSAAVGPSS